LVNGARYPLFIRYPEKQQAFPRLSRNAQQLEYNPHLRSLKTTLLLLLLLVRSCPAFYACLFFCDVNVQSSQQRFEGLGMFGFLQFLPAGYHPSCLDDFSSSDLAHLAIS